MQKTITWLCEIGKPKNVAIIKIIQDNLKNYIYVIDLKISKRDIGIHYSEVCIFGFNHIKNIDNIEYDYQYF